MADVDVVQELEFYTEVVEPDNCIKRSRVVNRDCEESALHTPWVLCWVVTTVAAHCPELTFHLCIIIRYRHLCHGLWMWLKVVVHEHIGSAPSRLETPSRGSGWR